MKKLTKKGTDPVRFTLNEKYSVVNVFDEFVSEQDRITVLRVRNMLNALLEEK